GRLLIGLPGAGEPACPWFKPVCEVMVVARSKTLHRFLTTILIAACALSQAQTKRPPRKPAPKPAETAAAPVDPSKWPLETFTVKGNRHYTREQILAQSGLRIGQTVAKADF